MPQLINLGDPLELIPVLEEAYLTEAHIEGIEPISPDSGYELPLSAARYTVSPSLLEAAIKQAQNEVELFAERLRPAVQMLTSAALAPKITQYLIGLV